MKKFFANFNITITYTFFTKLYVVKKQWFLNFLAKVKFNINENPKYKKNLNFLKICQLAPKNEFVVSCWWFVWAALTIWARKSDRKRRKIFLIKFVG